VFVRGPAVSGEKQGGLHRPPSDRKLPCQHLQHVLLAVGSPLLQYFDHMPAAGHDALFQKGLLYYNKLCARLLGDLLHREFANPANAHQPSRLCLICRQFKHIHLCRAISSSSCSPSSGDGDNASEQRQYYCVACLVTPAGAGN
jgi:hypothetical protein